MEQTTNTFTITIVCDIGNIKPKLQTKQISLELILDALPHVGAKIPLLSLILSNYNAYIQTITTEVSPGKFVTKRCNVKPIFWSKFNKNTFNELSKLFNKGRAKYYIVNDKVIGLCLAADYYVNETRQHSYKYQLSSQGA